LAEKGDKGRAAEPGVNISGEWSIPSESEEKKKDGFDDLHRWRRTQPMKIRGREVTATTDSPSIAEGNPGEKKELHSHSSSLWERRNTSL